MITSQETVNQKTASHMKFLVVDIDFITEKLPTDQRGLLSGPEVCAVRFVLAIE